MRLLPGLCPFLVGVVALPSQAIHVVGPGGMPQIRDALAVAAPGDTILVRPGTYAHFDANAGVRIRAEIPGTVDVVWNPLFAPSCTNNPFCAFTEGATRLTAPPGQTLILTGLTFPPLDTTLAGGAVVRNRVEVLGGRVVLDDCTIHSSGAAALSLANATTHIIGGSIAGENLFGTSRGLHAANTSLTVVGTRFIGSSPLGRAFAGEAIVVSGCAVMASKIEARGGRVLLGGPSAHAIRAESGSLWISDSVLQAGGVDSCPLVGNATVVTARCSLGAAAAICPTLPTGPLLGVDQSSSPRLGQTFTLQWRTQPGDLIGVLWSLGLATRPLAIFAQPWWAPAGAPVAGVFFADGLGAATGTWPLPADPAFVGLPLWFHSFAGVSFPFAAAPVAGGVLR